MTTWLTDNNGNKCSIEHYGSEEKAQSVLNGLTLCQGFINPDADWKIKQLEPDQGDIDQEIALRKEYPTREANQNRLVAEGKMLETPLMKVLKRKQ